MFPLELDRVWPGSQAAFSAEWFSTFPGSVSGGFDIIVIMVVMSSLSLLAPTGALVFIDPDLISQSSLAVRFTVQEWWMDGWMKWFGRIKFSLGRWVTRGTNAQIHDETCQGYSWELLRYFPFAIMTAAITFVKAMPQIRIGTMSKSPLHTESG